MACFAPGWYLTLFQRLLHPSECRVALAAMSSRRLLPTHVALGLLLSAESELLAASSFDAVTATLGSKLASGDDRRAKPGALRYAADAARRLPPAMLATIREHVREKEGREKELREKAGWPGKRAAGAVVEQEQNMEEKHEDEDEQASSSKAAEEEEERPRKRRSLRRAGFD